jgi:hypothetical protein
MTTLFLDYEGGNDNYGGTSFALHASGTDGRITTATFSAATASFPNDGSLIGQYLSIWNASIYAVYQITAWVSGTELTIAALSGGTALANQGVDRQYYIGGRWKTMTTGATAVRIVPGDVFRLMASPEPTSVGAGTWTSGPSYTGSSSEIAIQSSTNASPIVITSAAHGLVTGDTVEISGHTINTFANGMWEVTRLTDDTYSLDGSTGNGVGGATGVGRNMSPCRVYLDTACTQKIAGCSLQEGAWTASANVTATVVTTDYKGSYGSASIAVAAGFTTGKAAYFATGALDLSGYQQVTFNVKQTAGTLGAASSVSIVLCSDTAGATPVNTINLPYLAALNQWYPITVDTAGALGASIKSVALYVNTDSGAQTFRIGPIIACKASSSADSLSLTSLISKHSTSGGSEVWYGIRDINGRRVVLQTDSATTSSTPGTRYSAYVGTTENVTTYKRETIKTTVAATAPMLINEAGTYAAPFTLEGGWDRTNMSTQSGESWFSQGAFYITGNGSTGIVSLSTGSQFWNFDHIHAAYSNHAYYLGSSGSYGIGIGTVKAVACPYGTVWSSSSSRKVDVDTSISNSCLRSMTVYYSSDYTFGTLASIGSADGCAFFSSFRINIDALTVKYAVGPWLNYGGTSVPATKIYIKSGTIDYATQAAATYSSEVFFAKDCNFTLYSGVAPYAGPLTYSNSFATTQNENGNGVSKIYGAGGSVIIQDTTMVHGTASSSWKMSPVSTTVDANWPLFMPVGRIALAANVTKTIGYWMRRDNTGLTMKLICKGGQLAGIAADVTTSMTAAIDTWELVQISLTPTETGVVELEAHAYGGATYNGWVSEMEVA